MTTVVVANVRLKGGQSLGAKKDLKVVDAPAAESALLTLPDAARRMGIGVATIYDLNRRGEVPVPVLKIGKQYRIRKVDLEAYLAQQYGTAS
jgi:excisionase family DNA binding protein